MDTDPPEDAEPWQLEAWSYKDAANPFAQFESLFEDPVFSDLGFFPRGHGSRGESLPFAAGMLWGRCSMDPDEFEAAILAARDEYERRLGVVPSMIDLPNWVRGTILEQIAFTNGFNIAPRRKE